MGAAARREAREALVADGETQISEVEAAKLVDAAAAEGRAIGMKPGKEKQLVEYYQSKLKAPKAPQAPTVIIGE